MIKDKIIKFVKRINKRLDDLFLPGYPKLSNDWLTMSCCPCYEQEIKK